VSGRHIDRAGRENLIRSLGSEVDLGGERSIAVCAVGLQGESVRSDVRARRDGSAGLYGDGGVGGTRSGERGATGDRVRTGTSVRAIQSQRAVVDRGRAAVA